MKKYMVLFAILFWPTWLMAEEPVLTLLDAGQGPKHVLRLDLKPGASFDLVMRLDMQIDLKLNGTTLPKTLMPLLVLKGKVKVLEVNAQAIKYEFKYHQLSYEKKPGVLDSVYQSMEKGIHVLEGLRGEVVMTPWGIFKEMHMDTSGIKDPKMANLLNSLKNSMTELSTPFPKEGVGIGARWKVKRSLRLNGIALEQEQTFELLSFKGNKVDLKIKIEQSAPSQDVELMSIAPGAHFHLESLKSKGQGTMVVDLQSVIPESETDTDTETKMTVEQGGQKQVIEMDLKIDVKVGSK